MKKQPFAPDDALRSAASQAGIGNTGKRSPSGESFGGAGLQRSRSEAMEHRRTVDTIRMKTLDLAQRNMEVVLQVLKRWMTKE